MVLMRELVGMPEQLWEILSDGGEHRQVMAVNGHGTPGITIGKKNADDLGIEIGDTVGIKIDEEEGKIEIYPNPER